MSVFSVENIVSEEQTFFWRIFISNEHQENVQYYRPIFLYLVLYGLEELLEDEEHEPEKFPSVAVYS